MEAARATRPRCLHALVGERSEGPNCSRARTRELLTLRKPGSDGSSKFIFELPEPPMVDRAVLDFVKGHVFDPADFVIRSDCVCRLNPEMARMVVAKV
jgi:hypothetical protein